MSISKKLDETLSGLDLTRVAEEARGSLISQSMDKLRGKMSDLDIQVEKKVTEAKVEGPVPRYKGVDLADLATSVYKDNIKSRDREDKIKNVVDKKPVEQPNTIASRANVKALATSLAGGRSSGNDGRTSFNGPNGAGNVGKLSPSGDNGVGNVSNNINNYYALTTDMTLEEYEKYIQTIFEGEDCNKCEHEKKKEKKKEYRDPVSHALETDKKLMKIHTEDVVFELEQRLITLGSTDWIQVDQVLREYAYELEIEPRALSKEFKTKHGRYPDKWIAENLNVEVCGYMPLEEAARLNKVGTVYEVTFMFRGGTNRLKFFWPSPGEATKEQMQQEVEKFWPKARLIAFYPTIDNEQQSNCMVMAPPMTENYHFLQPEDWEELSDEASAALYHLYEEEGEPISFVLPDEEGISVLIEDHETGEERKVVIAEEGLHAWFNKSSSGGKKGWVQAGGSHDGKPCARQPGQKSTPKCVSSSKRASMSKSERASAHRRKNAADPNQGSKSGAAKPTYVSTDKPKTKKEEVEYVDEACWKTHEQRGMKKKGGKMVPNCVRKGTVSEEQLDELATAVAAAAGGLAKMGAAKAATAGAAKAGGSVAKAASSKLGQSAIKHGSQAVGNKVQSSLSDKNEEVEHVDEACWKGYEKKGMKTMFGKRYPNCVKKTKKEEAEMLDNFTDVLTEKGDMSGLTQGGGHKRSTESGAGLTQKGVEKYRRQNPGSKLKTAVTTPPSKLKPGSKAAKRRKSFCARSRGWTGERGKAARRRWNC